MTFFTWRQFIADLLCFGLLALPLVETFTSVSFGYLTFTLALILLSGFRGPGKVGSLFLVSLVGVHVTGLAHTHVGMEVGQWDLWQWFGGVYWHDSANHLQTNLAIMVLPFATLGLMGLRAWDTVFIIVVSILGFGLGVQCWGELQTIHAGASGVASGVIGAAVLAIGRRRFAWGLMPIYLWTGVSILLLLTWCLPRFAGRVASWEGHLGGLLGGCVGMLLVLAFDAWRRRQSPTVAAAAPRSGPPTTPFSEWAEEQGPPRK